MAINVGTLQAILKIEDKGVDDVLKRATIGLKALDRTWSAKLGVDASAVDSAVSSAKAQLDSVTGTADLGLDATDVDAGASAADSSLDGIQGTAELGVDLSDVEAGASSADSMLDGIEGTAVLGVDTSEVDSAIAGVQSQMDSLTSAGGGPGQALGEGFGLGGAVAGGALGDIKGGISGLTGVVAGVGLTTMLTGFVGDAQEAAQATATLASQVRVTGAESWTSAGALQEHASRLQELTGVSDEQIMAAQAQLLSFKNVRDEVGAGSDVYTRATKAAGDMAAVTGTDLVSANTMLGKALNDPIKGIGAMSRAGVQFTDDQKKMIEALVESGDTLGAQKIILDELEGQYGGTAEAQHGALGAAGELKVAWGELSETLGVALLPALEGVADVLLPMIGWFSDLPGPVRNVVVAGGLLAVALAGVAAVAPLVAGGIGLITGAAAPWLVAIGAVIAVGVLLYKNWDTIKEAALKMVLFVVDKFLWFAEKIVGAAAFAFGWIPGLGDKLRGAQDNIARFRETTNAAMDAISTEHPRAQVTHLIDLVGALKSPQPIVVLADTSQADRVISEFLGRHRGHEIIARVRTDASSIQARGDGPGGPMAPRGGRAMDRVRAILPSYPGLRITSAYRTPAQNRRAGGSPTSYHMDRNNPAVDIGGPTAQLDRFHAALGGGWREKLWRTKGHYDHVHVAHSGGEVASWWPKTAGLRWDERMAILQLGENVVPAGVALPEQRVTMPASRTYASAGRGESAGPTIINVYPQGSVITTRDIARDLRPFLGD